MRSRPAMKHARFRMDSNTMLTHSKVVVGHNGNAMSAEMKRKLLGIIDW
jgi:hypothetical protein